MTDILNIKVNGQWVGIPALKGERGEKGEPTALTWLELSSANWVQDGTDYVYTISQNYSVIGVYKGISSNKSLVTNADISVVDGITYITCQEPFNGFVLASTATNVTPASVYTHEQGVSSAQWVINHNLNTYPSVEVVDTSGNTIIGEVIFTNANTVTINFKAAFK